MHARLPPPTHPSNMHAQAPRPPHLWWWGGTQKKINQKTRCRGDDWDGTSEDFWEAVLVEIWPFCVDKQSLPEQIISYPNTLFIIL